LLHNRRDPLARLAPLREEVHQDRLVRVLYLAVEIVAGDLENVRHSTLSLSRALAWQPPLIISARGRGAKGRWWGRAVAAVGRWWGGAMERSGPDPSGRSIAPSLHRPTPPPPHRGDAPPRQ